MKELVNGDDRIINTNDMNEISKYLIQIIDIQEPRAVKINEEIIALLEEVIDKTDKKPKLYWSQDFALDKAMHDRLTKIFDNEFPENEQSIDLKTLLMNHAKYRYKVEENKLKLRDLCNKIRENVETIINQSFNMQIAPDIVRNIMKIRDLLCLINPSLQGYSNNFEDKCEEVQYETLFLFELKRYIPMDQESLCDLAAVAEFLENFQSGIDKDLTARKIRHIMNSYSPKRFGDMIGNVVESSEQQEKFDYITMQWNEKLKTAR